MRPSLFGLIVHLQLGPAATELLDEFADRDNLVFRRTEIPRPGELVTLRRSAMPEQEVAAERLQNVLPGTDGARTANDGSRSRLGRAGEVGDYPVDGPVAATNDIAGAATCDRAARVAKNDRA